MKLPDTVSDEQGALLEPSAVAVNAIDAAGVVVGSTVLITGAGPIGALVALRARRRRIEDFVYEPNAESTGSPRGIRRSVGLRRIVR